MIPADLDAMCAALVSWLLTYLVHSTILLSAAAVIAWRFAEHRAWLDLVWKAAVIGPIVSATLQPGIATAPIGGRWSIADEAAISETSAAVLPNALRVEPAAIADDIASPMRARRDTSTPVSDTTPASPSRESVFSRIVRRWPALVALSWLGIAIIAVGRYLVRLRAVYKILGEATPVRVDPGDTAPGIALGVSERCRVPIALAGRRIVVPQRFFALDPDQQRAALAHETAHVVRRDPEWLVAIELLTRAFFFQPLHRLARAGVRAAAECLCDQWAIRQTQSPLALAKCLSEVAAWSDGDRLPAGVSAMARNDSALIHRVNRILNGGTESVWRPRAWWLAIPIALVSVAAPRVTASHMSEVVKERVSAPLEQQRPDQTPAEIAAARAQLQVIPPANPAAPLDDRWRWALTEASRRRLSDFWVVYMFVTPIVGDGQVMSDTLDGNNWLTDGRLASAGTHLAMLDSAVMLEGGKVAVLLHYRGGAIDRAGYRSAALGFDFGRTPVFWLGHATESQSFARVRALFDQVRGERLQTEMIELASIHSDSNAVIPFLTSVVQSSRPAALRSEAAEGFEHHNDPRSVQVLLRAARTDPAAEVRSEAAETIGDVQTPASIDALTELVEQSPDPDVRREAAEAFEHQPPARAIRAIEQIVAAITEEDVVNEAIEALGELDDPGVVTLLEKIANTHQNVTVQREAVETLGDRHDDPAAAAALERIARGHPLEEVQAEAIETLADGITDGIHPVLLDLAARGTTPRIRREAIESIADSVHEATDGVMDAAERAITRAIFDDPDASVREEALDALEALPRDRALSILRDVIDRHSDARLKREAGKQIRERQ